MTLGTILIAVIPALLSVGAAVYATRSASRAKAGEIEAARLRQLEDRLSAKKIEMYEPMLRALGNMLTPDEVKKKLTGEARQRALLSAEEALPQFMNEAVVYASDEVLRAFARFRLAAGSGCSTMITVRLVADFMIAVRRDVVGSTTDATGLELLGVRINDLFSQPEFIEAITHPVDELARRYDWTPPWTGTKLDAL